MLIFSNYLRASDMTRNQEKCPLCGLIVTLGALLPGIFTIPGVL